MGQIRGITLATFSAQLPTTEEVFAYVLKGAIFYGPFLGWEQE
jgi:hypothetical protein